MYCITEEQISFILDDIRRNGIELEDLQLNLLDHICCIIEQELEENGDFERFYQHAVKRFYVSNLREIEEETIQLLTFKNYYAMKRVMIISGVFSAIAFFSGSVFKVMHWPGASVLILLGIVVFSLLFLPLMSLLKVKEATIPGQKAVTVVATITGILFCFATLFRVMHWPGIMPLTWSTLFMATFALLPIYFFNGFRRPEARLNTIMVSVILVSAIGLQFLLINLRPASPQSIARLKNYVQGEQILAGMQNEFAGDSLAEEVNHLCSEIKDLVMLNSVGTPQIPNDFEARGMYLEEKNLGNAFYDNGDGSRMLQQLRTAVTRYNTAMQQQRLPGIEVSHSVLNATAGNEAAQYTNVSMLGSITQLQFSLAGSQAHKAFAMK